MIRLSNLGIGRKFILSPHYQLTITLYINTPRTTFNPDAWVLPV